MPVSINIYFYIKTLYLSSEARLDIKVGGFWARGVTAFFDVRVTHVNSKCYQSKPTSEVFKEQEQEKKRKNQQRVLDVEMGSLRLKCLDPMAEWETSVSGF